MQSPLHKLRSYSDRRLMNVVIYRERYGYPFDYVEACKEELRRRGYTNAELQQAIDGAGDGNLPKRYELSRQLTRMGRLLVWLSIGAVVLFTAVFVFGDKWDATTRKTVGGIALLCMCAFFLAYTYRTVLRSRIARMDGDSSDNSSLSP